MTRAAVGEFNQLLLIFPGGFDVTVQTPAHVHHLRILRNIDLGHIPVTFLAVPPRRNMRAMVKLHEIRHNGHRDPFQRFSSQHSILERRQQSARLRLGDLIVTRPALRLGGQTGGGTFRRPRVTVQALNAKGDMGFMRELDGLIGRLLGGVQPVGKPAEQRQEHNPNRDQTHWLFQPFEKLFDHGFS